MLVVYYLMLGFWVEANCKITLPPCYPKNDQLIQCVTGVLFKYFTEEKEFTYVSMESDEEDLLKTIYSTYNFSLVSRNSTYQSFLTNPGYLIASKDVTTFTAYFDYLMTDPTWNPYARFLIIIKSLQNDELRVVFDVLLRTHVINVVVVNGTAESHLFTYNPFDNYACGRYYNDVISLGHCTQATRDLYPYKLVTGLKNCTFRASPAHRPPFAMNPLKMKEEKTILGAEENVLKILSEREQFKVIMTYNFNGEVFSTVAPNMTAIGPMIMLQKNETDVTFGALMLVETRAQAFTYLHGYQDYNEQLRFVVKMASEVPIWKTLYIEFDPTVWLLLLLSFIVYFIMMIFLLQPTDKGIIALEMLENLLLHSRDIRCSMTWKCILMVWVWFAYLINSFYQSSLYSLTTNPSIEYQVSNEEDLAEYNYETCFSPLLQKFILSEHKNNHDVVEKKGCNSTLEALATVSQTKGFYTLLANYVYNYYKPTLNNRWGEPLIYYFDKPYSKFLFSFYFYKGFPITPSLELNALRLRENGLAEKSMTDIFYARSLKQKFSQKSFEVRFLLPWRLYAVGCVISIVTFIIEYLSKYRAKQRRSDFFMDSTRQFRMQ